MQLLTKEQRRIREFVEGIAPKPMSKNDVMLGRDLQQLLFETAQHWDCATSLSVAPEDTKVSRSLGVQLSLMLAEAVANAVRHGGASNIDVAIEKDQDHLVVNVRDNGRGFGGPAVRYDHQELVASDFGPVSLRDRVGELGGSLAVSNSPMGAELEIRVPVS
jgi:signal transduction histidine kinase